MDESESQKIVVCNERSYVVPKDVASRIAELEKKVERMREGVTCIRDMTDADNPESYRSDDREGCLDTVFRRASALLKGEKEGEGKI